MATQAGKPELPGQRQAPAVEHQDLLTGRLMPGLHQPGESPFSGCDPGQVTLKRKGVLQDLPVDLGARCEDRLGHRDEGCLGRDSEQGQVVAVPSHDQTFRHLGMPEVRTQAEGQGSSTARGGLADVAVPGVAGVVEHQTRSHQELTALQPFGRGGKLRDVSNFDRIAEP